MRRPYVSSYFSPKRGATNVVIGFIDRTKKTLDAAIYSLTSDEITAALIRAHKRGVKVRLVLDREQSKGNWADDEKLRASGIETRLDQRKRGSMHDKFMLADGGVEGAFALITGSFNWSKNAERFNAENFVVIRLSQTVKEYQAEFDKLFAAAK